MSCSAKPIMTTALLLATLAGCQAQEPAKVERAGAVTQHSAVAGKTAMGKMMPTRLPSPEVSLVDRVVWNAQKQQGKLYQWGGNTPATGFDCSGLTQYAFKRGAQVILPRTAAEQYATAIKIPEVQGRKGDLVFFNTRGHRVSHVGIYLGNNRFLHAPRTGKAITTSQLEGYWSKRLVGFGRIPGACRPSYS